LKFKFHYIDKLEGPSSESVEAFLGVRVHETLEKLYKDLKFLKENSLSNILDYFNSQWKKHWNNNIVIVKKEYDSENYRKLGVKYITDYYNRFKPFDSDRTIATEKRIIIKLDDKSKLQGYIDRIAFKDKCYEIHDYKTNANLPMEEYLIEDRQLALYSIGLLDAYQDAKKVKLVWHFLAFDKDIVLEKTPKELAELRKDTIKLIKQVEASTDFPAKVSNLCDWCSFRPVCPQWKHLYKIEEKSPNEYLSDDGVKLVNTYAALDASYRKLKAEYDEKIEKLKQALIKYAVVHKVSAVFGSDVKANVKIADVLKFPGKNDEDAEELRKVLKALKLYDEASMVDNYKLIEMVKSGELDKKILSKLKKFERMDKNESVRLSKFEKEEEE